MKKICKSLCVVMLLIAVAFASVGFTSANRAYASREAIFGDNVDEEINYSDNFRQ